MRKKGREEETVNRYRLTKAGINPNQGIARFNGNSEVYETMINKFPLDDHFPKMLQAIAQKDVNNAFQYAHAVKGMVGNLSMIDLYESIIPLVDELRTGRIENIEDYLPKVKENYQRVIDAIGMD